ncbi:10350_t:CDS:2 [Funneliformis geosporum]|nr:10350_t:CDS:2 [Funneliformis geosporum]
MTKSRKQTKRLSEPGRKVVNNPIQEETIKKLTQKVDNLSDTVQTQTTQIENDKQLINTYQFQLQELGERLTKKRPRRLSLQSLNDGEVSFVNISPKSGLRTNYSEPTSPFRSPRITRTFSLPTASIPELDIILDIVQERETEVVEDASERIVELETSQTDLIKKLELLTRQLNSQEQQMNRLEQEKEEQHQQIVELSKVQSEKNSLQASLNKKEKYVNDLERELKETNLDFLTISENNKQLQVELQKTNQDVSDLKQCLEYEVNESMRSKESEEKSREILMDKLEEIAQFKETTEKEKFELINLISQQEVNYAREKQEREKKFQKQFDNLRAFQLDIKPDTIVFSSRSSKSRTNSTSRPRSITLLSELGQKGFGEKGGVISPTFTNSPLSHSEDNDFDSAFENKVNSPTPAEEVKAVETVGDDLENLLSDIDNLGAVVSEDVYLAVEEEKKQLHSEKEQLEKNFKIFQQKYELLIKELNREKIEKDNQLQKLSEKLAETEYRLAENEESNRKLKEQENDQLTEYLTKLEDETDELNEAILGGRNATVENTRKLKELIKRQDENKQKMAELEAENKEIERLKKLLEEELKTEKLEKEQIKLEKEQVEKDRDDLLTEKAEWKQKEQDLDLKKLEDKLKKVYYLFKKTSQKVENLKSQNTQEIQQKENELIGLKSDLEICQQEKLDISQKLNEAIEELANSNLTGQEKIAQIIKLTTENQKHFDKVNGYLDSA